MSAARRLPALWICCRCGLLRRRPAGSERGAAREPTLPPACDCHAPAHTSQLHTSTHTRRRYELHSEWEEALDHAQDRGKNTKVLLRVSDVGITYE